MKNFWGGIILIYTKKSNKKWRAHPEKFIKFRDVPSNFENKFLGEFSRHFKIFSLQFSPDVRQLETNENFPFAVMREYKGMNSG